MLYPSISSTLKPTPEVSFDNKININYEDTTNQLAEKVQKVKLVKIDLLGHLVSAIPTKKINLATPTAEQEQDIE